MSEKNEVNRNEESPFEKSFNPKISNIREADYRNAKGEDKKQCYITLNRAKNISLILPYTLDDLKAKYPNDRYPECLNIPILKDFDYHIVTGSGENAVYEDIKGTELRKLIDYRININLNDAYIHDMLDENGVVNGRASVWKNGVSFIIPKDWIREGQWGPHLFVKHNSKVTVSRLRQEKTEDGYRPVLDENGKKVYDSKEVTWAYVRDAFSGRNRNQQKQHRPFDEKVADAQKTGDTRKEQSQKGNDSMDEHLKDDICM